jgi:hypothetical protein
MFNPYKKDYAKYQSKYRTIIMEGRKEQEIHPWEPITWCPFCTPCNGNGNGNSNRCRCCQWYPTDFTTKSLGGYGLGGISMSCS